MAKLVITRGLPASGKTTWAKDWVAADVENRVRVNRDDIRAMLNDSEYIKGVTEDRVIKARDLMIDAYLCSGLDVVNDDTNLPQRTARDLRVIADRTGSEFAVADFTHVPVDVCVEREQRRGKLGDEPGEGARIIRDMYYRYLRGKELPLPVPEKDEKAWGGPKPYAGTPDAPQAVIVDIDGTVARMDGRNPYDYERVGEDLPNTPIIELVNLLEFEGYTILFVSGRDDSCYAETAGWLIKELPFLPSVRLYMRKTGDRRPDYVVKSEIFDLHIRDLWDVRYVLDDRNSVVAMWREMGLPCLQVAEGNF